MTVVQPARRTARIRTVTPLHDDLLSNSQAMDVVANCLRWNGIGFGPSDCGYTVWALPTHTAAVALVNAVLRHDGDPIPLTTASLEAASRLVAMDVHHARLASKGWPGPLTIVADAEGKDAQAWAKALGGGNSLGLRVSMGHIERQLTTEAGAPMTSAALRDASGALVRTYDDAHDLIVDRLLALGRPVPPVVGIRGDDRWRHAAHSTVVEFTAPGAVVMLREGALSMREIVCMSSEVSVHEYSEAT